MPTLYHLLAGILLGGGLIVAIGPQNLHLLQVGIQRRHVAATVAVCIGVDAVLITLGLSGLSLLLMSRPDWLTQLRWLAWPLLGLMALRSLREACRADPVAALRQPAAASARAAFGLAALVSLGNPAVWIETLLIVGASGASLEPPARSAFGLGALLASVLWFCALGYGARHLARHLQRPWLLRGLHGLSAALLLGSLAATA
ncbi:LysE/ArgO family amino acid transporter [Roseateles sp.]|uniref:LysE/ArgO family amino acid transporter n=1 Tax=Roseateles sp. TaxID=1971397 RepID=UPI0039E8A663